LTLKQKVLFLTFKQKDIAVDVKTKGKLLLMLK